MYNIVQCVSLYYSYSLWKAKKILKILTTDVSGTQYLHIVVDMKQSKWNENARIHMDREYYDKAVWAYAQINKRI